MFILGVCVCVCTQDACRVTREVCGHNGETYDTVCEAFSDRVAVDYQGRCHALGSVSGFLSDSGCNGVPCPPLSAAGCNPITPPGELHSAVLGFTTRM